MTPHQQRLLAFFRDYFEEKGISPTFEEMRAASGLASRSGIARLVDALVEQGHLVRDPACGARKLKLAVPEGHAFPSLVSVPTALLRAELDRRERVA